MNQNRSTSGGGVVGERASQPTDKLVGRYTQEDLRAIWDFVQHDFEGFLEVLAWLETLPDKDADRQLESARYLRTQASQQLPNPGPSAKPRT